MQKFYHSTGKPLLFFARHKRLTIFLILLFFLIAYFSPLFQFLPQALFLGRSFLQNPAHVLRSQDARTNILILGLGGHKNEPAGLTDTIIFSSFDHKNQNHLLLSLPRDIWLSTLRAKLNTVYYYGNREDGLGMEWAKKYVSEIVGQPVHYTVVVSFEGFVEIVDLLGGVEVEVERNFTDEKYPLAGKEENDCGGDPEVRCRYEVVSFQEGRQQMDGQTALKFVRSRNAQGEEGTDFARGQRQQKVLLAIKDRVFEPSFFLNSIRVNKLLRIVTDSIEMDVPQSHLASLGRLLLASNRKKIKLESVRADTNGSGNALLFNPPVSEEYDNQWVLVPPMGGWEAIHNWVGCLLIKEDCPLEDSTSSLH